MPKDLMKRLFATVAIMALVSGCANIKASEIRADNNPLSNLPQGKVLYIAAHKDYCDKIASDVDMCRVPKYIKVSEFEEQKRRYAVRIRESAITTTEYNPAGLLILLASIPLGQHAAIGAAAGQSNSVSVVDTGKVGFIINEDKIVECDAIKTMNDFNICRQQMLSAITNRRNK